MRVESRSVAEQRRSFTVKLHMTLVRSQNFSECFTKCTLTSTVMADDADNFAFLHFKINIFQCPEITCGQLIFDTYIIRTDNDIVRHIRFSLSKLKLATSSLNISFRYCCTVIRYDCLRIADFRSEERTSELQSCFDLV